MALDYQKYLNTNTQTKKTTSVQDIVNSVLKKSTTSTTSSAKQVNPPSKSPFNPNTPGHDEFVKQMDQRAPSTSTAKNFVSSIPGAFKKTVTAPVKFVTGTYLHPSEIEKQVEQRIAPTPKNTAERIVSAPLRFATKAFSRTFAPANDALGSQIGTAIGTGGKVLPKPREAFMAGANFGFGAGGAVIGAEGPKKLPVYAEKTPFVKSSEPILFKDSTIAPKVTSEIKAPVTGEAAQAGIKAQTASKPVLEPQVTPSEALKTGQDVSYPKTTKGGKPLNPVTYKPIEQPQIQTPEIKTSKLAQGVEAKAIAKKLTDGFEGLPEYAKVNVADQANAASNLIKTNRDQAINIAMGHERPPEGILPESVFVAVEDHALKTKDVSLLRDLATSSNLPSEATGMGQRIRMLAERDPNSAVGAMKKVMQIREEAASKKYGDITKAKAKVTSEIATEMKKSLPKAKDWNSFVESIKCK